MKTSSRRTDKKVDREHSKDDLASKKQEERSKKSVYSVTTPRNFVQKSSTADIYARKDAVKAPRKTTSNRISEVSPMKDLLKSSSSSVSQISSRSYKTRTPAKDVKAIPVSARSTTKSTNVSTKKLPLTNVTVSSPIAKRKLNLEDEKASRNEPKMLGKRERTNTRTLDEAEIKVLTSDVVDNNSEMLKLSKKLSAQPKAFFIELDNEKKKEKSSDEEVSYEDDFESYESDFDSYHSESNGDSPDDHGNDRDEDNHDSVKRDNEETNCKEERKLDSGNFELPERPKRKPMEFIDEGPESDKKISLTDEGFQDMSSGLSSMKTLHIDVLDRPLFIDFTKSQANRKKRKIFERLKKRADDILSMVTLHAMSYNLFEMKPIPYELYMATFGRYNCTQVASQTFDDGITEEVQTDEVLCDNKWTQHPIEFSNETVHLRDKTNVKDLEKRSYNNEMNEANVNESYMKNPLRVFFEQKDGAGSDTVLPYDEYKYKLKKNSYNVSRLKRFMKRVESRISNILSANAGNTHMSNLVKTSKFLFSTGYVCISTNNLDDKSLLKNSKIIGVVFSENKSNLIITIHGKFSDGVLKSKCALCLWDLSVAIKPLRTLMATDNVKIGKYRGSTDGYFVGALEDGSINLWDLSEEAAWCNDINTIDENYKESSNLTQYEMDREWNLRNNCNYEQQQRYILQTSAFTTSGVNVCDGISIDDIVGLEFTDYTGSDGSHVVAEICSLQRVGILTMWSIVREKSMVEDVGKALWSKMKLQKKHTIILSHHLDVNNLREHSSFDLNAAKKRMAVKKQENLKRHNSRPKSSYKIEFDRSNSVVSNKTDSDFWENGIVCSDLKIVHVKVDNYLVGKNFGEVLCCRKNLSSVKVTRFSVASPSSNITCLQTSKQLYFLAATDTGTINLCSLIDYRVLLTLDCRNSPSPTIDRCHSDHKGRFIGSSTVKGSEDSENGHPITSMYWSHSNPLRIVCVNSRVHVWSLAQSDVRSLCADRAQCCAGSDRALALLTPEGEIQVYELKDERENYTELFNKYVTHL